MNVFRQSLLSLGAIIAASALVYSTYLNFVNTPQFQSDGVDRERYNAWIQQSREADEQSRIMLAERMRQLDPTADKMDTRADVIATLESYSNGFQFLSAAYNPVENNNSHLDILPSIEEADIRQDKITEIKLTSIEDVGLGGRETRLLARQEIRLDELERDAIAQTEIIRGILAQTSVTVSSLIRNASEVSPDELVSEEYLISLRRIGVDDSFIDKTSRVMARITETRRLQDVLRATPLASPVSGDYRFTSGFGMRIDPFTLRPRAHEGLDIVAFNRAPVIASAPGRIVFAGNRSGYGNCVYIDHGYGFETRYAHLATVLVRTGQTVGLSDRIGLMGSTGRSTGTHLHWEILYRGRALDPMRFLQAGRTIYE